MYINGKLISGLDEQDVLTFVTNEVAEGKNLEFKQELCGDTDEEKREFLCDVSSFANAAGGHIVYGIEEREGIARSVPGLQGIDPDKTIARLESIIRDGIAHRIPGVATKSVKMPNGTYVIILQIPKSWATPHMVIYKGATRFYSRNTNGKYRMDIQEIRQSVLLSENLSERVRNFRLDRLGKVAAGETPIPLCDGAQVILHLIPASAFQSGVSVDFSLLQANPHYLSPICANISGYRYNLEGFLVYAGFNRDTLLSYLQIFRNGIFEAVDCDLLMGEKVIPSIDYESYVTSACEKYLQFLQEVGVEPPILITQSLLKVAGYKMGVKGKLVTMDFARAQIDRDALLIPEIVLETYPGNNLPQALKPSFDTLWSAAGWPRSMNYDDKGNWTLGKNHSPGM